MDHSGIHSGSSFDAARARLARLVSGASMIALMVIGSPPANA
jgi:hypothetical protein